MRNSRIPSPAPWTIKNGNCDDDDDDATNSDYNENDDDEHSGDGVDDDDTHIPGGSIGKQCGEDKIGREGDEVGCLAQRLQTWETLLWWGAKRRVLKFSKVSSQDSG